MILRTVEGHEQYTKAKPNVGCLEEVERRVYPCSSQESGQELLPFWAN